MENEIKDNIKLPENAFTELKEGEEYQPVMSPDKAYPEIVRGLVEYGGWNFDQAERLAKQLIRIASYQEGVA